MPGAQQLFGIEPHSSGKLFVTVCGQPEIAAPIPISGGTASQVFELKADEYEETGTSAQYFKENYNTVMGKLPALGACNPGAWKFGLPTTNGSTTETRGCGGPGGG